MNIQFISDPIHLGDEIAGSLESGRYNNLRVAVAYARDSGVATLDNSLQNFANAGGRASIIVGIDQKVTSYQSLVSLLAFTDSGKNLFIHHTNQLNETYHPKVYIFGGEHPTEKVIVGSSNMTRGGLYNNVEASIGVDFSNVSTEDDDTRKFRDDVENFWNCLIDDSNTARVAKPRQDGVEFLNYLLANDLLENEETHQVYHAVVRSALAGTKQTGVPFFGKTNKKRRKKIPSRIIRPVTALDTRHFAMTLSHFDTSEKSLDPIVLIPLAALRANKGFWKFPYRYTLSEGRYLQYYVNLSINNGAHGHERVVARIYFYKERSEFRFQCEHVKRNGRPGDIMLVKNLPNEYEVTLIRTETSQHRHMQSRLTSAVRGKEGKKFGYF